MDPDMPSRPSDEELDRIDRGLHELIHLAESSIRHWKPTELQAAPDAIIRRISQEEAIAALQGAVRAFRELQAHIAFERPPGYIYPEPEATPEHLRLMEDIHVACGMVMVLRHEFGTSTALATGDYVYAAGFVHNFILALRDELGIS